MKIIVVASLIMFCCASLLRSQTNDAENCNAACVRVIRDLIKSQKTGLSTSWLEKKNRKLGDKVAGGLMKIYSKKDVLNPPTVKLYLPIIREAFADPEMISDLASRQPRITLIFLNKIKKNSKQKELRILVDELVRDLEPYNHPDESGGRIDKTRK